MPRASVYWFTGLSGAGKSTVAEGALALLEKSEFKVLVLDGDDVRNRLHRHLGFTPAEIEENNSLIADLCADHRNDYDVILVPIIAPYARAREAARRKLGDQFHLVYFDVPLAVLEKRDTKGLYGLAERGEIDNLIGVSPSNIYEPPDAPDLTINTDAESVGGSVRRLVDYILARHNDRRCTEAQ